MRKIFNGFLLLIAVQVLAIGAAAQISITSTAPVTEDFNSIGSAPTATLPQGWRVDSVSGSRTSNYSQAVTQTTQSAGTTGTGALNTTTSAGGTYNFADGINASSTDRAVGWMTSGSYLAPRNLFAQYQNNTGAALTSLSAAFDLEKYRASTRGTIINFSYSTDGVNWTLVPQGGHTFAADATVAVLNPPQPVNKTASISGLDIAAGAYIYLRWEYVEGTGSGVRQGIGVDNVVVTAGTDGGNPTAPGVTVSTAALPDFGNVSVGTVSQEKVYTVSASNISGNLVITAPVDFLISTVSGSGYAPSLTLTPVNGSVPATDIFVVFAPQSTGAKTGSIVNSADGLSKSVAVSGTGVQNFTVSGQVTYKNTQNLSGITVVALQNGTIAAKAVTDASGSYVLNLPGGGNYSVTVGTAGFAFSPAGQDFPSLSDNRVLNFNAAAATLLISEFRTRGTGDAADDFVEIYNATDAPADVSGFAVFSSDNPSAPKYVFPGAALSKTTLIPARGHYLITGPAYSLSAYAPGDGGLTADIPDGAGIGLFVASAPASPNTKVDAVGFAGADPVFYEGTPLNPAGGITANAESSFVRNFTPYPTDTDNNAANFSFVSTDAAVINGVQSTLGAPGPENRQSPVFKINDITAQVLDAGAGITAEPNRAVNPSDTAAAPLGTIASRRIYTNNTGLVITKFRLRVIGITTIGSPQIYNPQAVVKVLNSADITVTKSDGSQVAVKGLTIEMPPAQPQGGGLNSSLIVNLDQPVAPGQSINVDTVIGIIQNGRLVFNTAVEAVFSAPPSLNEHLVMGNPSNAVANVSEPCNFLMEKAQYALSYCRDRGIPNWTSWHLDQSWLGSAPRQNDFREDTTLPAGWYRVQGTDYSGSGFDRGHLRPSGDTTRSIPDNSATFLMTNMMPQAPDNNQGPWEQLESYSRTLLAGGNELYIIAGGYGTGGTGSNGGTTNTIAGGKVAVPNVTWKVIMILPVGDNDAQRVTPDTRVIAVIMPNTQGIRNNDWRGYRVSVDQVEALTGFDFFSNVSPAVQSVIESRVDNLP